MKKVLYSCLAALFVFSLIFMTVALASAPQIVEPPCPDGTSYADWDYPDWTFWEARGFDTVDEYMEWNVGRFIGRSWMPITPEMQFWEVMGEYSLEEFLRWHDLEEDEYLVLEEAWKRALDTLTQQRNREIEALGGTPGIVNIMINDAFVRFGDSVPESHGNTVFVPVRAVFGALGASVELDPGSQSLTLTLRDRTVTLTAGENPMITFGSGTFGSVNLRGVQLYFKDNTSYVPVEMVARALGLYTAWVAAYDTMVIIDTAAIIEEADKSFTIINSVFDLPKLLLPEDGTHRSVLNLMASMTQFNSLDGDSRSGIGANAVVLSDGRNFSITGTAELGDLMTMLLGEYSYWYDDEELEEIAAQFNMFRNVSVDVIFNSDEGVLYAKSPLLNEIFPLFPAETWISIGGINEYFDGMGINDIIIEEFDIWNLAGFGATMGENVVSSFRFFRTWNDLGVYDEIMKEVESAIALVGDEKFVKRGEDYILSITLEDLKAAGEISNGGFSDMREFQLDLTIGTQNDEVKRIAGGVRFREGRFWSDTRNIYEFDVSRDRVFLKIDQHERNSHTLLAQIDVTTTRVNTQIPKAPPAGARIVDIEGFLGIIGGAGPDMLLPWLRLL